MTALKMNGSIEKAESTRQLRVGIYSCAFCKFIQKVMEDEALEPVDEMKYLYHLKYSHGVER